LHERGLKKENLRPISRAAQMRDALAFPMPAMVEMSSVLMPVVPFLFIR